MDMVAEAAVTMTEVMEGESGNLKILCASTMHCSASISDLIQYSFCYTDMVIVVVTVEGKTRVRLENTRQ